MSLFACIKRVCDMTAGGGNTAMPRRPATAMDHVIKENVVQPPVIRPKPLPVTGAAGSNDPVRCDLFIYIEYSHNAPLHTSVKH